MFWSICANNHLKHLPCPTPPPPSPPACLRWRFNVEWVPLLLSCMASAEVPLRQLHSLFSAGWRRVSSSNNTQHVTDTGGSGAADRQHLRLCNQAVQATCADSDQDQQLSNSKNFCLLAGNVWALFLSGRELIYCKQWIRQAIWQTIDFNGVTC